MTVIEWIVWAITETVKMTLITHGIMGFEVREGKGKYLVFLYLVLGLPIIMCFPDDIAFYKIIWGILFVQVIFTGKRIKKLQMFLIEYIAIGCIDGLVWSIFVFFMNKETITNMQLWSNICNTLGVLIWILLMIVTKRYRKQYFRYLENIKGRHFLLILFVLLCMSGVMANAQLNLLGEMTDEMRKAAYLVSVVALLVITIVFCIFAHTLYGKTQLEFEKDLNEKQLLYQKRYYEKLIVKEESVRRFRHEVKRHFNVLHQMVHDQRTDDMERYLKEISDEFAVLNMRQTGHYIVDYLLSDTIEELMKLGNLQFSIKGKFPEKLTVSDSDLCVLLGNALENVKEALQKVDGKRYLSFEIKSQNEYIFIDVCNTACMKEGDLVKTDKADKQNHGYGVGNMERIAEKNGGDVRYEYRDGMFCLEITIQNMEEDR